MIELLDQKDLSGFTKRLSIPLFVFVFFAIVFCQMVDMWGYYNDWGQVFYESGKLPLSPYLGYYVNTPWMALILAPFSLSTWQIGQSLWMAFSFTVITVFLMEKKVNPVSMFLVLTSPFSFEYLRAGQIDVVVLIGYMMLERNERFSIVFLLIKPQSILLSLAGKLNQTRTIAIDCVILLIVSVLIWGNWILDMYNAIVTSLVTGTNISPFPYLIPIGIYLLYQSVKKQDIIYGAFATLFFTPYILIHSLIVHYTLLVTRVKMRYQLLVYVIGWIYFLSTKGLL